ncbi:MAG: CHASE domain-containing protein [Phycisphaerales bacterium]|nr:CHASE domain-containing protein [Phycisphaerales bacterium]
MRKPTANPNAKVNKDRSRSVAGRPLRLAVQLAASSPLAVAAAVVILGMAWTGFGAWRLGEASRSADLTRFEKMSDRTRLEAERRIHTLSYGLRGARGAFIVSDSVNRDEFARFVKSLDVRNSYPGVAGFGFVQRVPRALLPGFIAEQRSLLSSDFAIAGNSDADDLYVTRLLEPADQVASELGRDLGADPISREAADRAMLTGEAVLSGPMASTDGARTLNTCLFLLPVYKDGAVPQNEGDRRNGLIGWVSATLLLDETLAGLTDAVNGWLDVDVYDARVPAPAGLLYSTRATPRPLSGAGNSDPAFAEERQVRIAGRQWTVRTESTPTFELQRGSRTAAVALIGGTLVSGLLGFLVWHLGNARARAAALAEEMTRELRGSERRFRAIADASPAMMWTSGADGACTYANQGWRDFTGAAMAECLGPGWSTFVHADDQDHATREFMRAIASRETIGLDMRLRRHDGVYRWCRFHAAPHQSEGGAFHGLVAVVFDINDQHDAADERLHQMQVQSEMSAVARVGGWELDPRTGNAVWSTQMFEIFDLPRDCKPELAMSLSHFTSDGAAQITALLDRAAKTGEPFDFTLPFVSAKGRHLWVRGCGKADRRPDGSVRLYGAMQDVTESRNAEESLRTERQRLSLFVEHAPAAIAMFDRQIRYIAVSRRWIADYGLEGREVIGRTHYEVFPNIPDHWKQVHQRCLAGAVETNADDVWRPEGWDRDQNLRWEVRPWTLADGTIGGIMMCTADTTLEKAREVELARMCRAAESASRAKSEFLANMSHEIRTPLTAIMGYADLLRDDGDLSRAPESRVATIDTIRDAGQHLISVINNILDLSKIEADKLDIVRGVTPLAEIIGDVHSEARQRCGKAGVRVLVAPATPFPDRIVSEPTFLRRILTQLVANAVKFTDAGTVTIRPAVVASISGACLRIDVEDTGSGMTREQSEKLFQPFSQVDSGMNRRFGGTGLGLLISKKLAVLIGGDVTLLHTAPGLGSAFRLELPLEVAPGSSMTSAATPALDVAPAGVPSSTFSGRILLAEDGPDNQRLIKLHLTKAGATVDIAENGLVALAMIDVAAAQGKPYTLLVSDMQMPEMDGYTLAQTLRQRGSVLPIVAVTAHAMAEDREKCLAAGCDDYDSKPIDRARLIAMCQCWNGRTSAIRSPSSAG